MIIASKKDVIWNYVGTAVSMAANFLLIPLLVHYLTPYELGLWYVYIAIAGLTQLFEFGFDPTFSRNIVFCMSGARKLSREGIDYAETREGVDWHLLKTIFKASRVLYAAISFAALVLVATVGSMYVAYISSDLNGEEHWIAWGVFCAAMFLNLFYLYRTTFLRGLGDIAGMNKAKTYARMVQLGLSAIMLVLGFGLLGAALGFLANGLLLRGLAGLYLNRHEDIMKSIAADNRKVTRGEVKEVFASISFIAWRDGVVQLSTYASTQASSIICSLMLSLAVTGTYSILLQIVNALGHFAAAFAKSYLPMFQAAYAKHDNKVMVRIIERSTTMYWIVFLFGAIGVAAIILPLLTVFKQGFVLDGALYLGLCFYLALLNHHSIYCNFIISTNRIPYLRGYLCAAICGIVFSVVLVGFTDLGVWGLVLGPMISQLLYNNWKWPSYVMRELGTTYLSVLADGMRYWVGKLFRGRK